MRHERLTNVDCEKLVAVERKTERERALIVQIAFAPVRFVARLEFSEDDFDRFHVALNRLLAYVEHFGKLRESQTCFGSRQRFKQVPLALQNDVDFGHDYSLSVISTLFSAHDASVARAQGAAFTT